MSNGTTRNSQNSSRTQLHTENMKAPQVVIEVSAANAGAAWCGVGTNSKSCQGLLTSTSYLVTLLDRRKQASCPSGMVPVVPKISSCPTFCVIGRTVHRSSLISLVKQRNTTKEARLLRSLRKRFRSSEEGVDCFWRRRISMRLTRVNLAGDSIQCIPSRICPCCRWNLIILTCSAPFLCSQPP